MAIDLPPGIQPALATESEIRSYQASAQDSSTPAIHTRLAGYDVVIVGNSLLEPDTVTDALAQADDLSDGVWELHYTYMRAGHRLTRLRYYLDGSTLYIRVIEGYIGDMQLPAPLERYFWEIEDRRFELPRLETRRILANLQASRLGLKTQSHYQPITPDSAAVRMTVESKPDPEHRLLEYSLEAGNPGNRFVGRYFALGEATLNTPVAQWKLNLTRSLNDSGTERDGDLQAYRLSANSVIPIGLFGGSISQTDYRFTGSTSGNEFKGDIKQAQILLQEIGYADTQQRNLLSQRLLFVDSRIQNRNTGQTELEERYFAVELGAERTRRTQIFGLTSTLKLDARLRKGLSDNSGTLGLQSNGLRRDARFLLFQPGAQLKVKLNERLRLNVIAQSQFADRQVPEQQQWLLGGRNRLRAWLPGALIGDTGHYLALELGVEDITFAGFSLRPSVFLEAGNNRLKSGDSDFSEQQRAYDAGIGLKVSRGAHWELALLAAEPVGSPRLNNVLTTPEEADVFFNLKFDW